MASNIRTSSKTLVQVCEDPHNGSILHEIYMNLVFDQDTFHCKLSTDVNLVEPDKKPVPIYLVLDAANVGAICLPKSEDVPPNVANAFVKKARCSTASDLVSLQFTLTQKVHLIVPKSALQKKTSTVTDVDNLLRLGQCDTFTIYVPSKSINQVDLPGLCKALGQGAIIPSERHLDTLYEGAGYKVIMCLDDLWTFNRPENPPPYDLSTTSAISGAIDSEPASQSDSRDTSSSRKRGKRRIASPVSRQTPSKRQLLTEKAVPEPWELAFAALSAEFAILREQVQQLQRAPVVDAGTQTDPFVDHAPESCSMPDPHYSSPSQASTVENSIEERLLMVEDSVLEEQFWRALSDEKLENTDKQLALLDEKLENTNKQIRQELDLECSGLKTAVEILNTRHDELQQEFKEDIDTQKLDLQVKLEEFIDDRLENVEEAVKHDVRVAFENASYKVDVDLGWLE
ncbi:hypothetical protein KCU95_g5124, partial [Aureobasidium melanogenum]